MKSALSDCRHTFYSFCVVQIACCWQDICCTFPRDIYNPVQRCAGCKRGFTGLMVNHCLL